MYSQNYTPQKQRFANLRNETTPTTTSISYNVLDSQGKQILRVEITGSDTVNANITPLDTQVSQKAVEEAKQDIVIATELLQEKARASYSLRKDGTIEHVGKDRNQMLFRTLR